MQKTLWATTPNDEHGLAEDKIAPPVGEEVHKARCFYVFQVRAGAPHMMLCLGQVRDSPQVHWQELAELCLLAIRKSVNPPKYSVAIHRTIVLKRHSDVRCLPIPISNMAAAIYVPSTLLKHFVKCFSPPGSLVQLALHQFIADQRGVHSPSVSKHVVSHSQVLILNTSWLSRPLQFWSLGVPHPIEHRGHQSWRHASHSSQWNTVAWHSAFPSPSHPLDPQAPLKTATFSENTSHRVNGIPVLQWLEVLIEFSHSSQFASPYSFWSCTNATHWTSQNSVNSMRVGHCLMVSLLMLRYHTTNDRYCIGCLARAYWCTDPCGWDSHYLCVSSQWVWNRYHMSSHRWISWKSLQLQALSSPGLVQSVM